MIDKFRLLILPLMSLCLCVSAAACSSSTQVLPQEGSERLKQTVIVADTVSIDDLNIRTVTKEDGIVRVNLSGKTSSNRTVYVKIVWQDADGMLINSKQSAWQRKKILATAPFIWEFVAPTSAAVQYQIIITDDIGDGTLEV